MDSEFFIELELELTSSNFFYSGARARAKSSLQNLLEPRLKLMIYVPNNPKDTNKTVNFFFLNLFTIITIVLMSDNTGIHP